MQARLVGWVGRCRGCAGRLLENRLEEKVGRNERGEVGKLRYIYRILLESCQSMTSSQIEVKERRLLRNEICFEIADTGGKPPIFSSATDIHRTTRNLAEPIFTGLHPPSSRHLLLGPSAVTWHRLSSSFGSLSLSAGDDVAAVLAFI